MPASINADLKYAVYFQRNLTALGGHAFNFLWSIYKETYKHDPRPFGAMLIKFFDLFLGACSENTLPMKVASTIMVHSALRRIK